VPSDASTKANAIAHTATARRIHELLPVRALIFASMIRQKRFAVVRATRA
jgi:hypothetical protein